MRNAKLGHAATHCGRIATCDHAGGNLGCGQHLDARAVERAKGFERLATLANIKAAVGEHTVHIEDHRAHSLSAQQQFWRKRLHRAAGGGGRFLKVRPQRLGHQITLARSKSLVLSAPTRCCAASTTKTRVMRSFSMTSAASTAKALA